jgi:prepilin-type N-terminal cleavage/methylation domain-containing protein
MKNERLKRGFSLTEVLMAAGILAVGLVMIAGTFPVAIFLTAASVEQTIAPIVADEAYAKIQLYANTTDAAGTKALNIGNLSTNSQKDFARDIAIWQTAIINFPFADEDFEYPSAASIASYDRAYSWAALLRSDGADLVQATVFISRKTGAGLQYPDPANPGGGTVNWPAPVQVSVTAPTGNDVTVTAPGNYITDGCAIVADATGNIYRVLDHSGTTVTLDRAWNDTNVGWVVPPPISGGRSPVIGVYQRIIQF